MAHCRTTIEISRPVPAAKRVDLDELLCDKASLALSWRCMRVGYWQGTTQCERTMRCPAMLLI